MFRPLVDRPGTVSTCPNCRQPFKLADSPHAPLILNCRHVCCEECIRTAFCTERHIICKECGMPSSSKPSLDVKLSNLRESFPLSEKMIEEINKLTLMKPVDESSIGFKSSKRHNCVEKPSLNSSLHEDACKECHDVVAILKCSDCGDTLLCQACFHAIHKFKTNRKHTYVFLPSTSSNVMDKGKKPEYVKQLREFREKLTKKQERIERSLMMLKNPDLVKEAQSSGIDVQQVQEDLKNFFLYCQNAIKGLENEVTQRFEAVANSLENSRKRCQKTLQQSQTEIVAVLKDLYKISTANFFDTSNVERLLVLSRDLLEKPDTIQTKRPIKGKEKVEMPSGEWLQILESQMNLDFGQPGEIYLVKNMLESDDVDICDSTTAPLMISSGTSDIGDTFERTSHSSLTLSERLAANQNSERRPSKTLSVQLPMYSNGEYFSGDGRRCESVNGMNQHFASNPRASGGRWPSPVQISGPRLSQCGMDGPSRNPYNPKTSCSRANSAKPGRYTEGWKVSVMVSCIYTPSCFYVQLDTSLQTLEKYRKLFKTAVKGPPIDKKDIQIGNNMYLAECSDGEWYRIRIPDISSSERSVLVTQVDTGRKETVDLSKIFRIEDVLRSAAFETELAIQCCIHNCCPIALTWRKEDIDLFTETLQNRKLTMTVFKVQSSRLEVDLEWNENGSYTTIRNYMLECRNACIAIQKENQSTISSHKTLKYFSDDRFSLKEWVDVSVTFVFGPHELYIKRIDSCSEEISEKMNKSIDAFYKQQSNYKQYPMSTPSIGLPVAAQFSFDNTWYRAQILNTFPHSNKAEVLYVDFGNKETLTFGRIRLLAKEFTKNTLRAVKCSLAGIKPATGSKYKPASREFLIENVENKTLKMVVEEVKPNELSVVLYRSDEDQDVCINSLLIDAEFAKKVGNVLGAASSYPKKSNVSTKRVMIMKRAAPKENQPDTPQKADLEKSEEVSENTLKEIEVQETGAESLNEHIEDDECENSSRDDVPQEEDFDNLAADKEHIRYEVKMISFISPNLFHVSLVQQVANVQETIRDMAKFYREKKDSPEWILPSVEKNVKCAAYSEKDDKWYRARVIEVKENDEVAVFFKDIAREETVKKEHLYSLDPDFNKLVDGTVACHMINIEERSDWPEVICESLKNSLDSYTSVHVAKMDKKENTATYPVELWGKTVACRGAFAPATEEWTNINELVMKALQNYDLVEFDPEHNKDNQSLKETSRSLDEDINEISSTETVKKWLHSNVVEASGKSVQYGSILANGEIPPENVYAAKLPTNLSALALNTVKTLQIYSKETPQPDWKPALPVDSEEFEVWPTYLDEDACFYLQSMAKQKKVIALISETLQTKFENSTPSPHDMHWYPGQICIAWFFVDKKWYRGKVLKVEDPKALVEYVDFGNIEWVEFVNLRKDIILENFPIQCHKFSIRSDVIPLSDDGKWSVKTLDFVHHNVIEKKFIVKLKKEKGENFLRIEKLTWVETGIELFEYLCDAGFTKFTSKSDKTPKKTNVDSKIEENHDDDDDRNDSKSNSSSSIAKFDSVSNLDLSEFLEVPGVTLMINDPFSIPQNPQENEVVVPFFEVPVNDLNIVTVEVIEILQLDEIVVHIVDSDNEAVNENRVHFINMNSELQQTGSEQHMLKSPSLGRMCCTQFDDSVWYRAKIIDLDEENEKVNILYVDYGNSSRADPSSLHEMKRSWFDVPMQSIRCKLEDFTGILSDGKEPDVEEMLHLINKRFEAVLEACEEDSMLYKIQLFFK